MLETLIISLNLGTPNVTFLAEIPAKWNVFNVIYVAGSPRLCAATLPTISPGLTLDESNRDLISPSNKSSDTSVNLSLRITFLAHNMCLK